MKKREKRSWLQIFFLKTRKIKMAFLRLIWYYASKIDQILQFCSVLFKLKYREKGNRSWFHFFSQRKFKWYFYDKYGTVRPKLAKYCNFTIEHLCDPLYFIIFYVIDELNHYYPSFDDFEKIKMAKSNCPGAKFKILTLWMEN